MLWENQTSKNNMGGFFGGMFLKGQLARDFGFTSRMMLNNSPPWTYEKERNKNPKLTTYTNSSYQKPTVIYQTNQLPSSKLT